MVHHVGAISELHGPVRGEPPGGSSTKGNALSAYRSIAHDITFIRISIQITDVPVKKTSPQRLKKFLEIGVGSFKPEIHLGEFWQLRHVNPRIVGRLLRKRDGRYLIFGE